MNWVDITLVVVGWLLVLVGFIGCFLPLLPGPPIAYVALFLPLFMGKHGSPSIWILLWAGSVTVGVTVLDYVVPALGARKFDCSALGTVGCVIGTIAGLFFLPFGVIVGPFLGAMFGEMIAGKEFIPAVKGAVGTLLGYVFGVLIKVLCCVLIAVLFYFAVP